SSSRPGPEMRRASGPEDRTPLRTWHRKRTLGGQHPRCRGRRPDAVHAGHDPHDPKPGAPFTPTVAVRVKALSSCRGLDTSSGSPKVGGAWAVSPPPHACEGNTGARLFATLSAEPSRRAKKRPNIQLSKAAGCG